MTGQREAVLAALTEWAERGWIRRLDLALARFVAVLSPSADGVVLVSTALVAHLEAQGHTCLVLDELLADPGRSLRWGEAPLAALDQLLADLPKDPADWIDVLSRCEAVKHDDGGLDDSGEPLVLSDDRLYLRRYWRYERRVAADVRTRLGRFETVDEPAVRRWLDLLFPDAPVIGEVDWQKVACAIALRGRLTIVTGGPGTGKTFTAARFLALLYAAADDRDGLRIALTAPTGKAAARLEQSIGEALAALHSSLGEAMPLRELSDRIGPACTLHGLLGTRPDTRRFRHDAAHPLDVDVVIVDEASMVHVEMMNALLVALPAQARVLLLGDKDQLASVEAGAVLGELCRDADRARYTSDTARYLKATTGLSIPDGSLDEAGSPLAQQTVMLRRSRRFSGDIGRLAQAVNGGDAEAAIRLLQAGSASPIAWKLSTSTHAVLDLASEGYRTYLEAIRRRPTSIEDRSQWLRTVLDAFDTFRILCAVREGEWGVAGLNRAIVERLAQDGLLTNSGEWYEGRPVIVTRNDHGLGVFNGDIGIALRVSPEAPNLRACFSNGTKVRTVGVGRLGHVETAFAMTVHKSQGSEFDHTVLVLPPEGNPLTTRELAYTGITRARSAFTLVSAGREALADAIAQTTRRSSGLLGFIEAP